MRKFRISLFPFLTIVALALFCSPPAYSSPGKVSVVNEGFNVDTDVVPDNLDWTEKSIATAKQAQRYLYRTIKSELSYLREQGAVRVERVKHPTESAVRNWRKLNIDENLYSLNGFDDSGNLVSSTEPLFALHQGVENRTVYLAQDQCLFRPFNLFDFTTWIIHQCSITVEPKEVFLRSAMQSWFSISGGNTPHGLAIVEQVKTVITEGISFAVQENTFYCIGCTEFINTPYSSFPLEYPGGLWPYKIKHEASTGNFSIAIMAPNYEDLMSNITLVTESVLSFEDRSFGTRGLFPYVE